MKLLVTVSAIVSLAASAVAFVPVAFAQNSPGIPGGILQDQFRLKEHPQMQFGASDTSDKYQKSVTAKRRQGDLGDPNGCNLKCPKDDGN
jgi:hypothetical protein